jgi:hypothetical protein
MKKKSFLKILAIASLVLAMTGCKTSKRCEEAMCTDIYMSIGTAVTFTDGQPVWLDSCRVFWGSRDITTYSCFDENCSSWQDAIIYGYGHYTVVNDNLQAELEGRTEKMHFVGYLNGQSYEQDVLVGANCCHVDYRGTEPLEAIVIDDAITQENQFCSVVNSQNFRNIRIFVIPFLANISNQDLTYEQKLNVLVDWLKSHSCISDAEIVCIRCVPTYANDPNNSKVSFSFVENGHTFTKMMLISGNDSAGFAGFAE